MATYHISGMVEGDDFRFGKNRQGDIPLLAKLAKALHFQMQRVEPVEVLLHDQLITRVSSTLTRWLLDQGRVADVTRCLGHAYGLTATVIKGEQRGRTINVPTVNLDLDQLEGHALPANGVYGGYAVLENGDPYPAAISLGIKPTFNGKQQTLEAHLLNFEGDLYDSKVTLQFTHWIRHQQPFPSFADLRAQLVRDINYVGKWATEDAETLGTSEGGVSGGETSGGAASGGGGR
ncbi:MAG: hypothetical protein JKX85_15825 [Phycisphaeraceae bacterium]|nr:hypothetical protein [Phycisphaeraceae bacterium]